MNLRFTVTVVMLTDISNLFSQLYMQLTLKKTADMESTWKKLNKLKITSYIRINHYNINWGFILLVSIRQISVEKRSLCIPDFLKFPRGFLI